MPIILYAIIWGVFSLVDNLLFRTQLTFHTGWSAVSCFVAIKRKFLIVVVLTFQHFTNTYNGLVKNMLLKAPKVFGAKFLAKNTISRKLKIRAFVEVQVFTSTAVTSEDNCVKYGLFISSVFVFNLTCFRMIFYEMIIRVLEGKLYCY